MQKDDYFLDEKEYKRYIIGKFKNDDFVPKKLKEYGENYVLIRQNLVLIKKLVT